jgi:hypothetical protein
MNSSSGGSSGLVTGIEFDMDNKAHGRLKIFRPLQASTQDVALRASAGAEKMTSEGGV